MSQHIDQRPNGKYRLRLTLRGKTISQTYDTLDQARLVRNQLLDHPTVGGAQAKAFLLSLTNPLQHAA